MQRDNRATSNARSKNFQERTQRTYRAPELTTLNGCSYNYWGALGLVFGINVPFVSRLASDVRDEDGCFLWSSPQLVLTLAEAADAYKNGNVDHNRALINAAVDYCNQFLPARNQLQDGVELRLVWLQHGVASVSCEENRRTGDHMDIVKHGDNTLILVAPNRPEVVGLEPRQDGNPLTVAGTPRPPRASNTNYNDDDKPQRGGRRYD